MILYFSSEFFLLDGRDILSNFLHPRQRWNIVIFQQITVQNHCNKQVEIQPWNLCKLKYTSRIRVQLLFIKHSQVYLKNFRGWQGIKSQICCKGTYQPDTCPYSKLPKICSQIWDDMHATHNRSIHFSLSGPSFLLKLSMTFPILITTHFSICSSTTPQGNCTINYSICSLCLGLSLDYAVNPIFQRCLS